MKKLVTLLVIVSFVFMGAVDVVYGNSQSPVSGLLQAQNVSSSQSTATGLSTCSSLSSFGSLGNCFIAILQSINVLIIAASVVYIVYGAFLMITSEEKRESGKQTIIYGIIGLFVMVSIWGFVHILTGTFSFTQNSPITPPELVAK